MKANKIRLLIAFGLMQSAALTQNSVYDNNLNTLYVSTASLNDNSDPVEGNRLEIGSDPQTSFTADFDKEVIGCSQIRLVPNTHLTAPATAGNQLHLSIAQQQLDIVTVYDISQVQAIGKFETRVELPAEITSRIAAYKTNDQDTNGLNPFMEWDVKLKATYTHINTGTSFSVDGFYMEYYARLVPGFPNANHANWRWQMTAGSEGFRVRCAFPELEGMWKAQYELYVENELYHSYCPFNVNVVEKYVDAGFVKVADNKRVLERNGELFLPIGHNMTWPDGYTKPNGDRVPCEYDPNPNIYTGYACESAAFYAFDEKLQDFANSGVDYFRFHLSPGSIDFEYEKMGNYFDRLNYADEIDKIIEFAESENMYVDFNMKVHYSLMDGPIYGLFAWDGSDTVMYGFGENYCKRQYCYVEELDMDSPAEFFTNPEAKKYYRQKMRYLISRWGYSSHIAMFELLSEINQVGDIVSAEYDFPGGIAPGDTTSWYQYFRDVVYDQDRPYEHDFQHQVNTYKWQKEMAEYIKDSLGHNQHILTCSYAGPPKITEGDSTFSIPQLDIVSVNWSYNGNLNLLETWQDYAKMVHDTYDKPLIFSESGPLEELGCSGKFAYEQELWQLPFTGLAGFNYWDGQYNDFAPQWAEMKRMKDWILDDPEKTAILLGDWRAGHANGTVRGNGFTYWRKDFNYILENNTKQAFGALINLTDNYFTNVIVDSSWCVNWGGSNDWVNDRIFFDNSLPNLEDRIMVKNDLFSFHDAIIQPYYPFPGNTYESYHTWYDYNTLDTIAGFEFTPSYFENWQTGLVHPPLYITDDSVSAYGYRGIMPFKSQLVVHSGISQNNNQTTEVLNEFAVIEQQNGSITIARYKGSDKQREVFSSEKNTNFDVIITNLIGQTIYSGKLDLQNQQSIDATNFPRGVCVITLVNNTEKHTIRWLNL